VGSCGVHVKSAERSPLLASTAIMEKMRVAAASNAITLIAGGHVPDCMLSPIIDIEIGQTYIYFCPFFRRK
jgi:hypothetical protein